MRFLLLGFLLLCSCDIYQSQKSYIEDLKKKGPLVFYTRNSMTTYYYDRDNQWAGYEYELAKAFSDTYDLDLEVKVISGAEEGFKELEISPKGHILGSGLTLTRERKKEFRFSESYLKVVQKVVCHRFGKKAENRNDLKKVDLLVVKDTSYEENIFRLKKLIPDLKWSTDALSSEEALLKVSKKEVDCTIVDSTILALQQRLYPELEAMFNISPKQSIHWFVSQDDYHMQRLINSFIIENQKKIKSIRERYFGYLEKEFDYYDKKVFERRIKNRLPQWKSLFKQAAKRRGFDWRLLAAVSYQESHWNKGAVSPTGVRGLMMLTRATAKRMGVSNRVDPKESIMAGAKYLRMIKENFRSRVEEEDDLLWISLASYNVGPGHIWDLVRHLEREKKAVTWGNIKELLPLLSKEDFFKNLKYGYANGSEPLVYVDHIRDFYKILKLKYKN